MRLPHPGAAPLGKNYRGKAKKWSPPAAGAAWRCFLHLTCPLLRLGAVGLLAVAAVSAKLGAAPPPSKNTVNRLLSARRRPGIGRRGVATNFIWGHCPQAKTAAGKRDSTPEKLKNPFFLQKMSFYSLTNIKINDKM